MSSPKPIAGFLIRFCLVYALLVAPWPGWEETYAKMVRAAGQRVFGQFGAKGVVLFAAHTNQGDATDTVIYLGNRIKLKADYSGVASQVFFGTRAVAYLPTALLAALILATPIPWRRRLWALLGGVIGMHLFLAFILWIMILHQYSAVKWLEVCTLSPFWNRILDALYEIFLVYLGARWLVAVGLWLLVCFRADDWRKILQSKELSPKMHLTKGGS